jgi:flagellar hook-length control protein FliK
MNAIAAALSPMTPPQATPQNARGDQARGDEFARCLDQARESEAPEPPEASEAPQRPAAKARSGRDTTATRKAEASTAKQVRPDDRIAADAAVESEADATGPAEAPPGEAAAPDIAALLPGWSPPAIVVAGTGSSAAATAASTDGTDALQGPTAASGVTTASPTLRDDTGARAAKSPAAQPVRSAATPNDSATTTSAPSRAAPPAAASEQNDPAFGKPAAAAANPTAVAFAAPLTTPAVTASKAAEAALPTATVQAAIDTPTFAPSLATQVRWWAHDGVQQAQLLLNPAEMGPVAVKIVLDGREARIDFSADLAATRGAIEAALPALAAALDDSGLKLSGGGVHDGSAQRQPAWSAHNVTHRTAAGAATHEDGRAGNAEAPRIGPSRGIVDLVA